MKNKLTVTALLLSFSLLNMQAETRSISVKEYRDKMAAGWIGQMVGVSLGAPTEFRWGDKIIPEDQVPAWKPEMINGSYGQDDLYVEMTFLHTLEEYGLDASIRQAGIDFANSEYPLWCANNAGRINLRRGIAPPDSGHPQFNKCPNDIDYQIEADYSGLIAPGIMQASIDLGEKFGRLMNYGDGVYAGQFIGALYAEAFFQKDPVALCETALKSIPSESQYAEMVRDMLSWYKEDPTDWEKCWQKCQKKYRENPDYQKASNGGIDCKINGAYVLMGLLFGESDLMKTMVISCRCGQDSDCNPSSSAGILFTALGKDKLPEEYTSGIDYKPIFQHTAYSFNGLLDVCEALCRKIVVQYGGKIEIRDGEEFFVLPVLEAKPSKMEYSWAPGPIANSRYTDEEMEQIRFSSVDKQVQSVVDKLFPGWKVADCGPDMNPGLRDKWQNEENVLLVHPFDRDKGCTLSRIVKIPRDRQTSLNLKVGNDINGDFDLIVKIDGETVYNGLIAKSTTQDHWMVLSLDLTKYAGKEVKIELIDQPNGWAWEAAYWKQIQIQSR